jgi:hypothetical protein
MSIKRSSSRASPLLSSGSPVVLIPSGPPCGGGGLRLSMSRRDTWLDVSERLHTTQEFRRQTLGSSTTPACTLMAPSAGNRTARERETFVRSCSHLAPPPTATGDRETRHARRRRPPAPRRTMGATAVEFFLTSWMRFFFFCDYFVDEIGEEETAMTLEREGLDCSVR